MDAALPGIAGAVASPGQDGEPGRRILPELRPILSQVPGPEG
jgi:hypothetical protein